jgi:6-phosphogluconolactonase
MVVIKRFDDEATWIKAVVDDFVASYASFSGEEFHACLSGGLTPEPIYRALAAEKLSGAQIHLWIGDERFVDPDSHDRNGLLIELIFGDAAWAHPPIIHPWPHVSIRESACARYESELGRFLEPDSLFDYAILGLGVDGHTAGLFKGNEAIGETELLAMPSEAPVAPQHRMTLTPKALNAAAKVRFLTRGKAKLPALNRLAAADPEIPASSIKVDDAVAYHCE